MSEPITEPEFYSPDNMKVIVPFLPREPRWLLLGGPADAREAQTARELWPSIKIVGVEPNIEAVYWQHDHGWPEGSLLLYAALGKENGSIKVDSPAGALRSTRVAVEGGSECTRVPAFTWDYLDHVHGPFQDAVLWMDIECHELEAIQGAVGILERGAVILVNVEMQTVVADKNTEIDRILTGCGFKAVKDWNDSDACRDRIYVRG